MPYRPEDPVTVLPGVGPAKEKLYQKLGIKTLGELVGHYPRRYLDCNDPVFPQNTEDGSTELVRAAVTRKQGGQRLRRGLTVFKATAADESGHRLEITVFNAKFTFDALKVGTEYLFYGRVTVRLGYLEMTNPLILPGNTRGLLPV